MMENTDPHRHRLFVNRSCNRLIATSRYKLAPANKSWSSTVTPRAQVPAQCYHGGGKIVGRWFKTTLPRPQAHDHQHQPEHALSQQNIRINVPSTFTIGIDTKPSIMQNAAVLLNCRRPAKTWPRKSSSVNSVSPSLRFTIEEDQRRP